MRCGRFWPVQKRLGTAVSAAGAFGRPQACVYAVLTNCGWRAVSAFSHLSGILLTLLKKVLVLPTSRVHVRGTWGCGVTALSCSRGAALPLHGWLQAAAILLIFASL